MIVRPPRTAARMPAVVRLCLVPLLAAALLGLAPDKCKLLTPVFAAEPRYVGPGSCSAIACHGAVQARHDTKVPQNEYSTWILQDKHARAWTVLNNPVSQRISKILGPAVLGAADAAHAPKCLACHALYVRENEQARAFDISDGVSCESCHGPSSEWLGPHTARDWRYEKSLAMGMYDTQNLRLRTEKCLTCHLGTDEKYVDHEMMAAGHPDLVFELDSFQAAEPVHWMEKIRGHPDEVDKDPFLSVREWSVGQAVQLKESMARLIRRVRGTEGKKGLVWPEYGEFDCFGCHHSLPASEENWRMRSIAHRSLQYYEVHRAGDPRYNMSRVVVFQYVANEVDATAANRLQTTTKELAELAATDQLDRNQIERFALEVSGLADKLAEELSNTAFDRDKTVHLMRAISGDGDYISDEGERSAEQAAMALDALYLAFARNSRDPNSELRMAIDALLQQLDNPSAFNGPKFAAAMKRVNAALR
jgi:Cytochrome c554 and c-prime